MAKSPRRSAAQREGRFQHAAPNGSDPDTGIIGRRPEGISAGRPAAPTATRHLATGVPFATPELDRTPGWEQLAHHLGLRNHDGPRSARSVTHVVNGWRVLTLRMPPCRSRDRTSCRVPSLAGPILDTLADGAALLIDEIDASIHPDLVVHPIDLFQDPQTNQLRTAGAQCTRYKNPRQPRASGT